MSISRKLLTLALALSALSLYGGNRAIDVPLRIPTGNTTKVAGVYAGDFTADGKADLLQVEEGKLRVLPNNGTPSFGNAIVTDAGVMFPEGIADFNGDGRQDLYYRTATGAGVIEGNAGGTFGATHAVPLARAATRMTAGELTGDAHLDLAVVSDADDMLTIYAGNGAGAFTLAREQTLSMYEPRDMAAADFDGDGRGDIIIANAYVTNIAWNEGTTFSIAAFEGRRGTAVATGDVNGDGRTDAAAYGSSGATILYGGSTRGTPQTISDLRGSDLRGTDSVTVAVTIAPLDGDARDEIVIATSGSITALSYDGTQFRPARAFLGGDGWSMHIAAADFTGDGHFDVVQSTDAYDVVDGYVTLARGRGDGTLRAPRRLLLSGLGNHRMSGNKPTITDLNGDTQPDIVIGMNDDDSIGVLMGRPDGSFAPVVATDLPRMDHPVLYEAGDLNGDGRMDMVRISSHTNWYAGGSMETWLGQSDGTFVAGPTRAFEPSNTGTAVFLQAVLDYTGDGYRDVLDTAGRLFPGSATGAFGAPIATGINTWAVSSVVIGDDNNDGRPDILVNDRTWRLYVNQGGGSFSPKASEYTAALADLNGDGVSDRVGSSIQLGTGGGSYAPRIFEIDAGVQPAVLDVDGDAHRDVATATAIYFGTGDGTFADARQVLDQDFSAPHGRRVIAVADFDGNGSPDLWLDGLIVVPTRVGEDGTVQPQVTASTSPEPSGWQRPVDLIATVAAHGVAPRGAVRFSIDAKPFGIFVMRDGVARRGVSTFPIGSTPDIDVDYLGDGHYAPGSASTSHTTTEGQPSLLVLSNDVTYALDEKILIEGRLVTGSAQATGTITYRKGDVVLFTRNVTEPQTKVFDNTTFPLGTHTVTAEYSGDANFFPATGSVTFEVHKRSVDVSLTFSPQPSMPGPYTITLAFPRDPSVTGTVTFSCFEKTIGTVAIANAQASSSVTLAAGSGSCVAFYSGDDRYQAAGWTTSITIYGGTFPMAAGVTATWNANANNVSLAITPISGATSYDIYRGIDGAPLSYAMTQWGTKATDHPNLADMTTAVYTVIARDSNNASAPMGPRDIVTRVSFTDASLIGLAVKAVHVVQLQSAINAVRRAAGLTPVSFDAPSAGSPITSARIHAMRGALGEARTALGLPWSFAEASLAAIRASHLDELRAGVQ